MHYKIRPILALLVLIFPLNLLSQTWTAEQMEVWESVSNGNQLYFEGNVEGHYETIHPEFIWWNSRNPIPGDYDSAKAFDTVNLTMGRKVVAHKCTPLSIQAYDSFAIVNYYCRIARENGEGQEPEFSTERWHMVFKKEDDKWLQIANYGD